MTEKPKKTSTSISVDEPLRLKVQEAADKIGVGWTTMVLIAARLGIDEWERRYSAGDARK